MRNLGIQSESKRCIHNCATATGTATKSSLLRIVDVCSVDTNGEDATCLLTSDGYVALVDHYYDKIIWEVHLSDVINGTSDSNGEWFSLTYVEPSIIALNRKGSIVSMMIQSGQAELVGEFENGIRTAAWSPDRSVLVLVTAANAEDDEDSERKNSVLLSMNSEWDVVAEVTIDKIADDHGGEPVSLCWTSSLFAVNSVDAADCLRKIRIYKGDTLELHAVGRTEDGSGKLAPNVLYSEIAWAGAGCSNLLAAVQKKGKKSKHVAFFEPNGLRHRELVLRGDDSDCEVTGLQWNLESDLLAVTLQQGETSKVQLWHRCNYHWYMKYECRYNFPHVRVKYHDDDPYLLYILLDGLRWIEIKVRWDVSTVTSTTTAFSIDGCLLNMTNFEQSFMAPPMYANTLQMSAPIREITVSKDTTSSVYGVVSLSSGTLVVLGRCEGKTTYPSIIASLSTLRGTAEFDVTSLRKLTLVQHENSHVRLIAVGTSWDYPGCDFLVEVSVSGDEAVVTGSHALGDRCLTITAWSDAVNGALVQMRDGRLLEYEIVDDPSGSLTPSPADALLEPCPWLSALKNVVNDAHHQRLVVGMSLRFRLYCNDFLVSDSISSFALSMENQFLCYATAGPVCVLRFVSLQDLATFDPLLGSDENHVLHGYEPRNVERGSRLVAVLSRKPSAVLQMPRGNLEIIHPRALVLRHAMLKTKEKHYKEAFELMRRQKVDMNLIVDMSPVYFLEYGGVTAFVEQIESIDHLNLFIACLQDWDSTDRYPIPHWIQRCCDDYVVCDRVFDFSTKLNQVCRAIRAVMIDAERNGRTEGGRAIGEGHFLLPILSTFAKEDPPQLENALQLILENALRKHPTTSKNPPLFSDTAQSSIQYLAFLADYELLFETALGLYDYDMARAVARNSQMDPKSYLPLLKFYRGLPMYYGRFLVDARLKRFESALRNLFESGAIGEVITEADCSGFVSSIGNDFDACLKLIEEQHLHRLGLELFDDTLHRNRIMLSLGDQLMESKQAETALCIFLTSNHVDEERCMRAAREARDWATLFSLPSTKSDLQKQNDLAREIADDLVASCVGRFKRREMLADASRVLLDYAMDVPGAVDMMIMSESWSEGRRIGILHDREDLSRKVIDAAVSYAYSAIADFDDRADAFLLASERYEEVLKIRKEAILAGGGATGEELDHNDNGSLFSAVSNASNLSMRSSASTGSVGSLSSVISVKSTSSFSLARGDDSYRHKSKFNQLGRQKPKKKKKSKGRSKIRPDSEEELQGLVQTLKNSCVDDGYSETVGETITFLVQNSHLQVARALYDSYVGLRKKVEDEQEKRIRKRQSSAKARREGFNEEVIAHSVEAEVDALACPTLPSTLHEVFSFLPAW